MSARLRLCLEVKEHASAINFARSIGASRINSEAVIFSPIRQNAWPSSIRLPSTGRPNKLENASSRALLGISSSAANRSASRSRGGLKGLRIAASVIGFSRKLSAPRCRTKWPISCAPVNRLTWGGSLLATTIFFSARFNWPATSILFQFGAGTDPISYGSSKTRPSTSVAITRGSIGNTAKAVSGLPARDCARRQYSITNLRASCRIISCRWAFMSRAALFLVAFIKCRTKYIGHAAIDSASSENRSTFRERFGIENRAAC